MAHFMSNVALSSIKSGRKAGRQATGTHRSLLGGESLYRRFAQARWPERLAHADLTSLFETPWKGLESRVRFNALNAT